MGRYRWPTQLSQPKTTGEIIDGPVETGGALRNEILEGSILGVDSLQTHQTPV